MTLYRPQTVQRQALYLFDPATEKVADGWSVKASSTGITIKMKNEALQQFPGMLPYIESLPYEGQTPIGADAVPEIEGGVVKSISVPALTERYVVATVGDPPNDDSELSLTGKVTVPIGGRVTITMELKTSNDPGGPTWDFTPPRPLSVPVRRNGLLATELNIPFVNGTYSMTFVARKELAGLLEVMEQDFDTLPDGSVVKLIQPVQLIVQDTHTP